MGFGLIITSGDNKTPLADSLMQWLVEVRVEMELSKPTRYAMRFEDDVCEGEDGTEFEGAAELAANQRIGIIVSYDDTLSCLAYGPVTEVKSSAVLGGAGSWIEVHGEDRRVEMGRVGVQATYTEKASAAAAKILQAHAFTPDTQDTLIEYDAQKNKLTQRATDLAFLEDIARRNNMEFWISYEATPNGSGIDLKETAKLRTSPHRSQAGDVPQVPTLVPDANRVLKVNPGGDACPTVNKFDAKIDYEKPTASKGFAMTEKEDQAVVEQIVKSSDPVDPGKPVPLDGVKREVIAPPASTPEQAFLKKEAIVYEQSWFVEVDCSSTLEQLEFVVSPHQIVNVANAGERLSGAYQVMKATHVVTSTDHFMDFTLRANGLGGAN